MHVERLRRPEPVRVPHLVHDLFASDDLARPGHQHAQQIELLRGELDRLAALVTVRDDGSSDERADVSGPRHERRAGAPPALDRTDARDELAGRERLDDVVVGAELEADDPVDLLAASGQHDDRHVRGLAHLPAEVPPVTVGQHHVEQDHVGLGSLARRLRASAIVPTTSASNPSLARCSASGSEIASSSSTTSTRVVMPSMVASGSA